MTDKLNMILKACKRIYGKDFTANNRHREDVYARACFYIIARDMLKAPYQLIGDVCGQRSHATVLHAVKKAKAYSMVSDFNRMLTTFKNNTENLAALKVTQSEFKHVNDALRRNYRLKVENERLRQLIKKNSRKHILAKNTRERLLNKLLEIPEKSLIAFEQTRLTPYLKMLNIDVHNLNVKFDEVSYN